MKVFVFLLLVCSVGYVHADVVWPAILITAGWFSFPVILSGLLIETWFVKHFTKVSWIESFEISVAMNGVTAILGIFLINFVGLAEQVILRFLYFFKIGSFHWIHWLASYVLITLANTAIEGLVVREILNHPLKKTFSWLFCANAISIIICAIYTYYFVYV